MSALKRLQMLTKALLPQFRITVIIRSCSASAQQNSAEMQVSENDDGRDEVYYRYSEYESLLENKLINKKQLRSMMRSLNRDLRRGSQFAKHLSPELMQELILLPSWTKKHRFLRYYREKEMKELRRQNPRSRTVYDEPILKAWTSTDELPGYGLCRNCIFRRMSKNSVYTTLERNMINFFPFTQKVALDFAYDQLMTPREINKLSVDVKLMFSANRVSTMPLNLHLCSFDSENSASARLIQERHIDNRTVPFPYEVSPKTVVDLFPRERLIYLAPEGDEVLDKLDSDMVYVLGALVDKIKQPGASARRARELGIRSMRFPGSFYLRWEENGEEKPLHLTHCLRILSKLSSGCSWEEAAKNIHKNFVMELEC